MKIRTELIEKYNYPVPRYTSYPPANRFNTLIGEDDYYTILDESNGRGPSNISFYVHIPYCKKLCFYCGCNSCKTGSKTAVDDYFRALEMEIEAVTSRLDTSRKVSQIHFGGGTPNSVPAATLRKIVEQLLKRHTLADKPEIAVECHPAYLDEEYIGELLAGDFNRFSLGIQDFDTRVLKLVNREPSRLPVEYLIDKIRGESGAAVNLDFIYGLPGQSAGSFVDTVTRAAEMKPDRIVTFSYAHVPWVNKNQSVLEKHGLPDAITKVEMFEGAFNKLIAVGYKPIGFDHFVAEGDELDVAASGNMLHRNFQGYSTLRTTGQVYAFGASGISQPEGAYVQNIRNAGEYTGTLLSGKLPVVKGHRLDEKELFVKGILDNLMCNRVLDIEAYTKGVKKFYEREFDVSQLNEFLNDGLITINAKKAEVTDEGLIFIRNVAACLDPEFSGYQGGFSKPV